MASKVYAIKKGYDFKNNIEVKNKIVNTWNECLGFVKGVKGAEYKSFKTLEEAEKYINAGNPLLRKGIDEYPLDAIHAYVDGSFNESKNIYSYAAILVKDDVIIHIENGASEAESSIRQIAGELKGTIRAAEYAAENNLKDIVIFHDYAGICYHAVGYWERKDKSSKEYHEKINNIIDTNGLNLTFVKVDSHTGDIFNETADEMAKLAASVQVKGEVAKYLRDKTLMVKDEETKEKLSLIIPTQLIEKIIIIDD